jgi:uncharacterized protein YtpQ (UPF0354 family)
MIISAAEIARPDSLLLRQIDNQQGFQRERHATVMIYALGMIPLANR